MKRTIYFLITIVSLFFYAIYLLSTQNNIKHQANERLRIIVNLDTNIVSDKTLVTHICNIKQSNIQKLFTMYKVTELQAVYRNRYDGKGHLKSGIISSSAGTWRQIILNDNNKAKKLVALLTKEKGVLNTYIEQPIPIKPCIVPNDPLYSSQWHLRSISYPIADIDAEQAWDINRGRNDVIIAVCDGGVDYTHPDLDPSNRSRVIAGYDSGNDDNDPMDDLPTDAALSFGGHGTHVAGIIGAIANNQAQVSGIMWNCKIMPVKMVGNGSLTFTYPFGSTNWDFSTTAFPSDVADAIDYAVNNGAHVINLSYGFDSMGALLNDVILRVPLLYNAILNAYNHNVVVIAAMGNEYLRGNPIQYPAAFREVIAVGSMRNSNPTSRSSFSSTGNHICVSAPGDNILSTIRGGGTGLKSGTSMAAPVVSGVAGLIISQGLDRNFNLTNDDVRHILERTADDITSTGIGFDNETGHGKINALSALSLLNTPNILYHGISTGGTSVKLNTIDSWVYVGSRWNLASGVYLSVDQYQITKHITFDVPFCSIPQVWVRERESLCMSFAQPNDGYPYSEITNITNTGFDVRYAAYYVRYNISGQTVNKWVPAAPASTNISYTAVGQPHPAGAVGPLSGPSTICPSGTTFTVNNVPAGCTVSWACSSNISFDNQTGNPKVFTASGTDAGWVQATINSGTCSSIILPRKDVWNVPPATYISFTVYRSDGVLATKAGNTWLMCPNTNYHIYMDNGSPVQLSNYNWTTPSGWTKNYTYQNMISVNTNSSPGGQVQFGAYVNDCNSNYNITTTYFGTNYSCGGYYMAFSPNPATEQTTLELSADGEKVVNDKTEWELEVYDQMQSLKEKKTKLNGIQTKINTSGWKDGVYVVRAKIGDEVITEKLIVKH